MSIACEHAMTVVSFFRNYDKRRAGRMRTIIPGLVLRPGVQPLSCSIRNVSETGAKVYVGDLDLPEEFDLCLSGMDVTVRVRSVWRKKGFLGLVFAGAPRSTSAQSETLPLT